MTDVRPARADEVETLLDMYQWLFDPPGTQPPSWDRSRAATAAVEAIESGDAEVFVADRGGRLVGFCTAYLELNSVRFGRRCWVEDLAVDPAHRSQGIGARLLAAAREWAREGGATHLELDSAESRTDAHRFYEREGADHRSLSYGWELDR
jgi:GNAT superfamily N-acetyltransferase